MAEQKQVTVTPALLEAIRDAARFYENVGDGEWLVYNRAKYRYFNPDLAVMRDKAVMLSKLAEEMGRK